MERSPEFEKYIDSVRKLPQETIVEKSEKQEKAKILRMEVMLENAALTEELVEFLKDDPLITSDDLIARYNKKGRKTRDPKITSADVVTKFKEKNPQRMIAHPEVVQVYVKELLEQRTRFLKIVEFLKRSTFDSPQALGGKLYEYYIPQKGKINKRPQGPILVDTSFPLSVVMYVFDEYDFSNIDSRVDLGGFYNPSAKLDPQKVDFKETFPLIVLNGAGIDAKELTRQKDHEKGHVENKPFRDTFSQMKKKAVWGHPQYFPSFESLESAQQEYELETNPHAANLKEKTRPALEIALLLGKDEILADLNSTGSITQYVPRLIERGGTYDYFEKVMKINPGSKMHNELWSEYESIIASSTKAADRVLRGYDKLSQILEPEAKKVITKKSELFRWVLAQIPLDRWEKQLNETLFVKEAEEIDEFFELYENYKDDDKSQVRQGLVFLQKKLEAEGATKSLHLELAKTLDTIKDYDKKASAEVVVSFIKQGSGEGWLNAEEVITEWNSKFPLLDSAIERDHLNKWKEAITQGDFKKAFNLLKDDPLRGSEVDFSDDFKRSDPYKLLSLSRLKGGANLQFKRILKTFKIAKAQYEACKDVVMTPQALENLSSSQQEELLRTTVGALENLYNNVEAIASHQSVEKYIRKELRNIQESLQDNRFLFDRQKLAKLEERKLRLLEAGQRLEHRMKP